MATKVMMEALSPTMEEGRLVKWLKNVGDPVKNGETLAEVETDKAIMELVARGEGVLRARMLDEGGTTAVGTTIAVIAAPDEDISAIAGGDTTKPTGEQAKPDGAAPNPRANDQPPQGGEQPKADDAKGPKPVPESEAPGNVTAPTPAQEGQAAPAPTPEQSAQSQASVQSAPSGSTAPGNASGPVRSSPLARRLAAERGVNLGSIHGSGPNGRVIRRDIESAASGPAAQTANGVGADRADRADSADQARGNAAAASVGSRPTPPAAPSMQIDGEYKDVSLTQMRKTIARRLSESIGPVPTFYLTAEIDMTNVAKMRAGMTEAGEQYKVSVNDIVIKAVAIALSRHPEVNAHWLGDKIRYFSKVHVGMAVATDDGLIVPVIFDASTKGLGQIGREAKELAKRARERKLQPAEFTGATFSVSNLGMFGIDQFTAIINPPEAAILAVGATETKPVFENGTFIPRERMRVTMSCDHRIIDGAVGARFLQTLTSLLEQPMLMLY